MIGFWPTPCLSRHYNYEIPMREHYLEESLCGVRGPAYENRFYLRLDGWPSCLNDPDKFYGTWDEGMDCRKQKAVMSVGNFV